MKPRFLYACSPERTLFYDTEWKGIEAGEFRQVNGFMSLEEMRLKIEQAKNVQIHIVVIDTKEKTFSQKTLLKKGGSRHRRYLKNMLNRDEELAKGRVQIEHPLLIDNAGGKQTIKCANTEGIFPHYPVNSLSKSRAVQTLACQSWLCARNRKSGTRHKKNQNAL